MSAVPTPSMNPKKLLIIVATVIAAVAAYNFVRNKWAKDKLPDLQTIGS